MTSKLILEMPESAFGTLHPFRESAEKTAWVFRRRHPEHSDYYRLLESGFEVFAGNWPEDFEACHGFLRKEVQSAVFSFLE